MKRLILVLIALCAIMQSCNVSKEYPTYPFDYLQGTDLYNEDVRYVEYQLNEGMFPDFIDVVLTDTTSWNILFDLYYLDGTIEQGHFINNNYEIELRKDSTFYLVKKK